MGGPADRPPAPFAGRFTIRRALGAGGFGKVFEAYDHEREVPVALKKLTRVDAAAIYHFKQEFRSLADVLHPNLVRFHELFAQDDEWWFTMELVEGMGFETWIAGRDLDDGSSPTMLRRQDSTRPDVPTADPNAETILGPGKDAAAEEHETAPRFVERRLRDALAQLAAGVHAIHEAGKLHCDLKPSNVLVTHQGRVVILDFGLVAELADGRHQSLDQRLKGTPAYMPPELIAGQPLTPASDWYAVGVMLYEILRGKHPFSGNLADVLAHKQTRDPLDPRLTRPDLPPDLCELSMELLRRDPLQRPSGAEILRRVALPSPRPPSSLAPPPRSEHSTVFVGRTKELERLRAGLEATRGGKAVVARITGAAGIGKTALLRRFLETIGPTGALVLAGRCYERETVPFKAFDGIVDALTQHLRGVSEVEAARLLPRDALALARLFPVYGRLASVGGRAGRAAALDPHELRRRAFTALREVLSRITDTRPLLVLIDDLQWGDADSAALLADLLAPPDPPAMLLIASHRSDDAPAVRALAGEVVELPLGPLEPEEAEALAAALLASQNRDRADAAAVARESGGNPLLLEELARHVGKAEGQVTLQGVLAQRIAELPEVSRHLLEVVAVAGGPIDPDVARRVSGIGGMEAEEARAGLRSARLLRAGGRGETRALEVVHDAVRESVLSRLAGEQERSLHRKLAEVFAAQGALDPEKIARHFRAAGETESARPYTVQAAGRAAEALAFDQAAALYRLALDPPPGTGRARLLVRLGEALANAGRGADAARAFLDAVPDVDPGEALDLQRRAAETLLRSGHIDEGKNVVRAVLQAVGLKLPRTAAGALASVMLLRTMLKVRGLEFATRSESDVPPDELRRIDVCWSVGNGLGGVDLIRGAEFQARHILLALEAGEPYRIARAMAWEAILAALEGRRGAARAALLTSRAEQLAQEIAHPHALGWAIAASAVAAWCEGNFRQSIGLCEYGAALFRERCADISWEVGTLAVWWHLPGLLFLGELEDATARTQAFLREAEDRGDLYAITTARANVMPRLLLAADDPAEARREADEAVARWSTSGFHLQHWAALHARCEADLYEGAAAAALERLDEAWPELERSQHLRSVAVRGQTFYLRARCRLAAGRAVQAEADVKRLEHEHLPWTGAAAMAVRAGITLARGDRAAAADELEKAAAALDEADMALHAAAARLRAGELRDGEAGAALAAAARAVMAERKVAAPERYARLLAPGTPGNMAVP